MSKRSGFAVSAMPILPIFHGSGSISIEEETIEGLPYRVEFCDSGLLVGDDFLKTEPLVYTTSDPLLALAYTLRRRLPDADMVFSLNADESGLSELHIIFFTIKNEQGFDATYDEWGQPLILFEVEPQEGKTFLNLRGENIHLASEWIIAGKAKSKAVACFKDMHELALAGIQIYTMDGSALDMWRRPVAQRQKGWDEDAIPFAVWAKMMGEYTYPTDEGKRRKLWSDFCQPDIRQEMLRTGVLTHLNPQLQGALPQNSFIPNILDLRFRLASLNQRIYGR